MQVQHKGTAGDANPLKSCNAAVVTREKLWPTSEDSAILLTCDTRAIEVDDVQVMMPWKSIQIWDSAGLVPYLV